MASTPKPPLPDSTSERSASDRGSLDAWAVEYGPALKRYFRRRAAATDVDDLVQDVFLKLQSRDATTTIENVEGYIFRTAASVLATRLRRETWRWGRQEDLDEAPGTDETYSPERILIGRQAVERLMVAISELPPRTAQAFLLHRFENLTREAVGRRMGISRKGVEAHLKRALRRLHDELEWRE